MELLRLAKRKTLLSEISYYLLNVGLAVLLFFMSQTIQAPTIALILVVLSKWRVLAVRPRFWLANIQANMVDLIVGVSIVTLMYVPYGGLSAQQVTILQAALASAYAAWLVLIKPLSGQWHMLLQSAVAVGFGTMALFAVAHDWWSAGVVAGTFVIGYSATRHFLVTYEEKNSTLLSAIWGIVFAEVGLLAYYWTYSYAVPGLPSVRIPQATIILLLLSFVAERAYRSWHVHEHKVVSADVMPPLVLVTILVAIILLFFNSVTI